MNNKNIIIAGVIAIGAYLLLQAKKISGIAAERKTVRRSPPATTPTIRQRTAQQIGKIIGKKVAQKVDISKLSVRQLRYMIAHAAVLKKTGKEVAPLKAEVARREVAWLAAHKVAQKKTGKEVAASKAEVVRGEAAQKIGKIIGKKVAQKIWEIKGKKVAQKKVASWKAPFKSPNSKFRVITPSDLLKNLAKKDIAQKKVVQQKEVKKTTPDTPSDKTKSRLKALYGPDWYDIWLKRQKR